MQKSSHPTIRTEAAFSRLELLAVMLILALWVAVAWPVLGVPNRDAARIQCLNNLRRVGIGFHLWAAEHQDQLPWRVDAALGGAYGSHATHHLFAAAAPQFGTPNFLVCPNDWKSPARSFAEFDSNDLSYFAGLHASQSRPRLWLAGDGNVSGLADQYCKFGGMLATRIYPDATYNWSQSFHVGFRNILLGDGSAALVSHRQMSNEVARATAEDAEGIIDLSQEQF